MDDAPQDGKVVLLTSNVDIRPVLIGGSTEVCIWAHKRIWDRIGNCWRDVGFWWIRNTQPRREIPFEPAGWRWVND